MIKKVTRARQYNVILDQFFLIIWAVRVKLNQFYYQINQTINFLLRTQQQMCFIIVSVNNNNMNNVRLKSAIQIRDDKEECFIQNQDDNQMTFLGEQIDFYWNHLIKQQQPANQLIPITRPTQMFPRTLYKQILFQLLPQSLQTSSIEQVEQSIIQINKATLKIINKQQVSLLQYFERQQFKCIYQKYTAKTEFNNIFCERMKPINTLCDYNWKLFKELQVPQSKKLGSDIQLDSNFECGNMAKAYTNKNKPNEYYILLENDTNTHGYNNWFFYRINNANVGTNRFHILNMSKKTNNYKQGMLISIFSIKKYSKTSQGWFKGGNNLNLHQTKFQKINHPFQFYYCLSFQYDIQYENDEVYFAMNKPYTYSRLVNFIQSDWHSNINVEIQNMGYTISNNIIPYLRLGLGENINSRKAVIFMARQHPSQSMGSFIMESLMKIFNEKDFCAEFILNNFQIILIPMINPDGVIHGNSRCNFAGVDLNRQWGQNCMKELSPQTFRLRQFFTQLQGTCGISLMVDLHGHAKKLNTFFFNCKAERTKQLSLTMAKIQPKFSLESCTFGLTKDKQNTVRNLIFKLCTPHSYTLQNSFYGYLENGKIKHFTEKQFKDIADSLIKSIFVLLGDDQYVMKRLGYNTQTVLLQMQPILQKIQKMQRNERQQNEMLSESDPDGDILNVQERINVMGKDERLITKKMRDIFSASNKLQNNKKKRKTPSIRKLTYTQINNKSISPDKPKLVTEPKKLQFNKSQKLKQKSKKKSTFINHNIILRREKLRQRTFIQFPFQEVSNPDKKRKKQELKIKYQNIQPYHRRRPKTKLSASVIYQYPEMARSIRPERTVTQNMIEDKQIWRQAQDDKFQLMKKVQANKKFKNLREESQKALLKDSLAIFKLDPRRTPQNTKYISQANKKQMKHQNSVRHFNHSRSRFAYEKKIKKYDRFENFVSGESLLKDGANRSTNSVFYYFPVL